MAKTAVVNPKRRRRRKRRRNPSSSNRPRRRRRNYGAAAVVNRPRRRRRRRYGAARRRRRNPASPYASTSYYRRPNPGGIERMAMDLVRTIPAATAGVMAARFAVRQAGSFEAGKGGVLEPTAKHAVAILIAAELAGRLLGEVNGAAGDAARISALGFGGDLFLRTKFMRDSTLVQEYLSLQGMGAEEQLYVDDSGQLWQMSGSAGAALAGFQNESALGDSYVDSAGNVFLATPQGWALAGALGEQFVQTEDGRLYQLNGSDGAVLDGFQNESALGMGSAYASQGSSFGYSPR